MLKYLNHLQHLCILIIHYEESDRLKLPYPAEGRLKDFKVRLNPPGRSWTKAIQGCILAYGHSRQALCEALRAFCDDVLRKTGMQGANTFKRNAMTSFLGCNILLPALYIARICPKCRMG